MNKQDQKTTQRFWLIQTRETWAWICSGWRIVVTTVVTPVGMAAGATAFTLGPKFWIPTLVVVFGIGLTFSPNPRKDAEELVAFVLLYSVLLGMLVGLVFSLLP